MSLILKLKKNKKWLIILLFLPILIPFCLMGMLYLSSIGGYTQVYFKIELPDSDEFAEFLQSDGWEVDSDPVFWCSVQGKALVDAKKRPFVFFSRPKIHVRLFRSNKNPKIGEIAFFISEGTGNMTANRIVFEDFVEKVNERFDLGLSVEKYNYFRSYGYG